MLIKIIGQNVQLQSLEEKLSIRNICEAFSNYSNSAMYTNRLLLSVILFNLICILPGFKVILKMHIFISRAHTLYKTY